MAQVHRGHVADVHRHPVPLLQHDGADVVQVPHQAHAADQVLLGVVGQHAAAGVGVVAAHGLVHVGHGELEVAQLVRVHQHLVLLDEATLGVDFGDAGNGAQQGPHHPVLGDAALGQLLRRQGPLTVVGPLQGVLVDFAEAGGDGAEHRGDALGQARTHFQQAFHDQLAGEVDVGAIGEHQGDEGEARLVQGTHLRQAGQAGHGDFQGHRGEALHLLRRAAGGLGGDLHLDVGDVGEGIHRQLARGVEAEHQQGDGDDDDDQALFEGGANQGFDHDIPSMPGKAISKPLSSMCM